MLRALSRSLSFKSWRRKKTEDPFKACADIAALEQQLFNFDFATMGSLKATEQSHEPSVQPQPPASELNAPQELLAVRIRLRGSHVRSAANSSRSAHAMETALDPIVVAREEVVHSHVCLARYFIVATVHEFALSPAMTSLIAITTRGRQYLAQCTVVHCLGAWVCVTLARATRTTRTLGSRVPRLNLDISTCKRSTPCLAQYTRSVHEPIPSVLSST